MYMKVKKIWKEACDANSLLNFKGLSLLVLSKYIFERMFSRGRGGVEGVNVGFLCSNVVWICR